MKSSTAATADATNVAVRHGRTSASLVEAEDSTPESLRRLSLRLLPRRAQAVLEGYLGLPPELACGVRRIQHATSRVARPGRPVRGQGVYAGDLAAELVQPVDGRLDTGADVEDAFVVLRGGEDRRDDVADVHEVAALLPVAEDQRLLAGSHPFEEDRDDTAFERGGLARPVDVGEAQHGRPQAVNPPPASDVCLSGELRHAVRGHRPERCVLCGRGRHVSVDGAARRREHDRCAGRARRLEDVERAEDVHLGVEERFLHRRADIGLRGEVEDDVRLEGERLSDVVLDQLGSRIHELPPTGREVIDDRDLVSSREQRVHDVRADEPGASGDERSHAPYRKPLMFVTFEGVDGSGKSTQAALLAEHLSWQGRDVVSIREPGGTPLGEHIRDLLLDGEEPTPWAEAALFAAARAELAERVIRPALEDGADVVCDRYLDSSLAYQGVARGLGIDRVLELNVAVSDLTPDRTFVLLLDSETATARSGSTPDRIEREDGTFRAAVADGYRQLADRYPDRIVVLDGSQPADDLAAEIRAVLDV
jgi:dTMP kinase